MIPPAIPQGAREERPLINWPAIQHAQLLAQNEEGASTALIDAVNALATLVHRLDLYAETLRVRCDQQERENVEAKQRMHLILSTIYSTQGYLTDDGEIDTAAKFRAIERLARLDWNADGTPRSSLVEAEGE